MRKDLGKKNVLALINNGDKRINYAIRKYGKYMTFVFVNKYVKLCL